MTAKDLMKLCQARAEMAFGREIGNPFGAVITHGDDILAISSDTTIRDNDPTHHAVMNAISTACSVIGSRELIDCEVYTVGYPCPMCMSAIIASGIKVVHVSGTLEGTSEMGYEYDRMYEFLNSRDDNSVLEINDMDVKFASNVSKAVTNTLAIRSEAAAEIEGVKEETETTDEVKPDER